MVSELKSQEKWDIFCKVVDNFGDIGVCWRLAKQLKQEHGLQIRLFIDDLSTSSKILTGIGDVAVQSFEGVSIVRWDEGAIFESTADVVVETFSCGLPAVYLSKLSNACVWVNVDYLSAEPWVSEFHALNGKHQDSNKTRHFYFPGFSENTGGLLREQDLITQRDAFQQSDDLQRAFWQSLTVEYNISALKISIFSYTNAPVGALLESLADGERPVSVFMPMNSCVTSCLGREDLTVGDCLTMGSLTLYILPFLSQDDYDRLLWGCDINFVRGEDSWVRAVWAGKPFIWQPYLQTDNAHLVKLNAFIDKFYNGSTVNQTTAKLHESWSIAAFSNEVWQHYLNNLVEINAHTQQQSNAIIKQEALAAKLIDFCANLIK